MAGRPKIYDEEQVIDKAINVFWDTCYDAVSADELLEAMGIGKGSFYLNFKGGKQELYERSLKQFAEKFHQKIEQEMIRADDTIAYIRQLFLSAADAPSSKKNRGCYYGNALVQLSAKDKSTKQLAAQLLNNLHGIFTKAIRIAQKKGQIQTKADPELLSWHLSNLWNGINVTRRMQKSPETLRALIELNLTLLQ